MRAAGPGPIVLVALVMLASGALLVRLSRSLWFYGDDWSFLLDRGTRPGGLGLLAPHNEHWSTIPILIYRALYALFGLAHFMPYMLPVIAAHLTVVAVMFVLFVRLGANPWIAAGSVSVFAFLGSGAQNTLWAFQIGFVGSVALGLLAVLLYDSVEAPRYRLAFVWLMCVLSLMCSGIGITMVILVAAFALGRHGPRAAVAVASVPAAVYALWYAGWGRSALRVAPAAPLDYLKVPEYIWTAVVTTWDRNIGMTGSGAVVAIVLIGSSLALRGSPLSVLARAGVLAALAQLLLIGISRIGLGVEQATASRYNYLVSIFMLPAVATLLSVIVGRWRQFDWLSVGVVGTVFVLVTIQGIKLEVAFAEDRRTELNNLPEVVAAGVALVGTDAQLIGRVLEPAFNPNITSDALADPRVRQDMAAIPVTQQGLLEAAGGLQVALATSALDVPMGGSASVPASGEKVKAGCAAYVSPPTLIVQLDAAAHGGQLRVTSSGNWIQTRLHRGPLVTAYRVYAVTPEVPVYVGTSSQDTLEIIVTGAASATLCNGG